MDRIEFRLEVTIDDRTGTPRAAYLQVRNGEVVETRDVCDGRAYADYDGDGHLVGIELLAECQIEVMDRITLDEPEPIREFFRSAPPRKLMAMA